MEFILDVSCQSEEARMGLTAALANRVEAFVKSRFELDRGYCCKRRTSKPFQERPHLLGHHVLVQKGFLWGFEIRILPDDFQVRRIKVSLLPQPRVNEAVLIASLVPGLLAGLAGAILTVQQSRSDTVRNVMLAFFLCFFGVAGILFGIAWLISKMLIKSFTDPSKDQCEREALWRELLPVLNEKQA